MILLGLEHKAYSPNTMFNYQSTQRLKRDYLNSNLFDICTKLVSKLVDKESYRN